MKEDYTTSTDEELILRLRDGEAEITEYLMNKYKNLVRMKASSMFILGADTEDLIQEGMIGLFKALRDYDAGRDASFATFANLCVLRQMYTAVEAAKRQKHIPLNTYTSLFATTNAGEDENYLVDSLKMHEEFNPEEMVIDEENRHVLEEAIEQVLSPLEKQVLDLHMTGMNYVEIAKVLGRDEKSIDNALHRMKSKIKRVLT